MVTGHAIAPTFHHSQHCSSFHSGSVTIGHGGQIYTWVGMGPRPCPPTTPKRGDARWVDEVFAIYSSFLGIASFFCLILLWLMENNG
jgi:hypothetical protein